MKKTFLLAVTLVGLVSLTSAGRIPRRRLPVQVYVESLCPDSMRFIQNQLNPIFNDLQKYIDISFIPFGKADSHKDENGNISFTCQHGSPECEGNMLQSCALLAMGMNERAQMEFMACQMQMTADRTGETCLKQVGYSFRDIQACINSSLGTSLQLAAEKLTKNVLPGPLFWVPTIVFDWNWDRELHDRSQTDFLGVVCEQLDNAAPICNYRRLVPTLCSGNFMEDN